MVPVVVGLGSNIGEPLRNIAEAVAHLRSCFTDVRLSPLYSSSPMYVRDQPDFVNGVASFETTLSPRELLGALKRIEQEMGRVDGARFGPRCIDLDLLIYGSLVYEFDFSDGRTLRIPHPRMTERKFVMAPLADLAPDLLIPGLGKVAAFADNEYEGQHVSLLE